MPYREIASAAAIALTFIAFVPYIRAIHLGGVRPHVFSWVIWATTTFIVFLAQLQAGGGIGAWPIGMSGLITGYIATLAWLKRGDSSITRSDRVFLVAALSSLPLWWFSADPLWAVAILTLVDLLGFGPTLRKAWQQPREESPGFFALFAVRNGLVLIALDHHSLTTVLFPAAIGIACILLIMLIIWRRQTVSPHG